METSIYNRTLKEIEQQIERIKSFNLEIETYENIFNEVNILMNEYVYVRFPAFQNTIYRLRINEKDDLYTSINDLWAPKAEEMDPNRYNRANTPQNPVFYCSNEVKTAISEISLNEGDCITVMECRAKENLLNLETAGLGFDENLPISSKDGKVSLVWGQWKEKNIRKRYMRKYSNDIDVEDCIVKNKLIDNFLNEEFRKKVESHSNYKYKITAAIAALTLGINSSPSSAKLDGISYPSMGPSFFAGYNWAFTTNAINKYYEAYAFETIQIGKIEELSNGISYKGNPLFKGVKEKFGSKIIWERVIHPASQ